MSGWFLLASAFVQYQRKINLLKKRRSKEKAIQLFFRTHEKCKNRLHKKMILRLSKCKKVLLMNINNTKEK